MLICLVHPLQDTHTIAKLQQQFFADPRLEEAFAPVKHNPLGWVRVVRDCAAVVFSLQRVAPPPLALPDSPGHTVWTVMVSLVFVCCVVAATAPSCDRRRRNTAPPSWSSELLVVLLPDVPSVASCHAC